MYQSETVAATRNEPQVPRVMGELLHFSDALLERLGELDKRLSAVVRHEPSVGESADKVQDSPRVSLANDMNVALGRVKQAAEHVNSLLNRLEL